MKKIIVLLLVIAIAISNCSIGFASGKKIEAFKWKPYGGNADYTEFINGIQSEVSAYTYVVKNAYSGGATILQSDFKSKSKAIKYWSSYGSNSGYIWGNNGTGFNVMNFNNFRLAQGDLEFVFLAAPYLLDGSNQNPRTKFANAMLGMYAVRVICGYHDDAPLPNTENYTVSTKDKAVAINFINKAKTGESVKSSWMQANQLASNSTYCVLTHSGNVQYSRFEGFPGLSYSRPDETSTTILRFSAANPSGTVQPLSKGFNTLEGGMENLSIPTYSLRATPVNVSVNNNVETVVLKTGPFLTTQNGEIKDNPISITDGCVTSQAQNWFTDSYKGIEWGDYANAEIEIRPIVMAEVNLDGNIENEEEVAVAYDFRLKATYDGIPVIGDMYCAIIDGDGVVSSGVSHNTYEVVTGTKLSKIDISNAIVNALQAERVPSVEDASVVFADEDGDGIFDPTVVVRFSDGRAVNVNCMTGVTSCN